MHKRYVSVGRGNVLPWVAQTVVVWVLMRFCAMNLINIQTTTVSVQVCYINPIARHPVGGGNVLPWVAQTVVVWVLMRFCAMNLINIQTTTVSVQVCYINPIERHPLCPGNVLPGLPKHLLFGFNVQCLMFNVQCLMFSVSYEKPYKGHEHTAKQKIINIMYW